MQKCYLEVMVDLFYIAERFYNNSHPSDGLEASGSSTNSGPSSGSASHTHHSTPGPPSPQENPSKQTPQPT